MKDLIERQAAIDAIENEQMKIMRSDLAIDQAKFSAMSEIRALIADLPSVSTEKTDDLETKLKYIEANIHGYAEGLKEQTRWIPVSERVADFPCLACDIYEQIFIPFGVVTLNNRCFDGKDFKLDVEKFLKGKEVTLYSGEKVYELPREIVAWMPLPQPYKAESEVDDDSKQKNTI